MAIMNACKYSEYAGPIDTLIAIGGDAAVAPQSPDLQQWLRDRAPYIRRIASVCTGAFILASAGLLDGLRVATHWLWCDLLQTRHKRLNVERDPIFIKQGKFYTTGSYRCRDLHLLKVFVWAMTELVLVLPLFS
jgi:transcriptional regulator GlxA family with amidase domain